MRLKARLRENLLTGSIGAALTIMCGAFLWWFPIGEGLEHLSYDVPFMFGSQVVPQNVIIVEMDEHSHTELNQAYGQMWDRALHAKLLNWLRTNECKMVVLDLVLADAGPKQGDEELAKAIKDYGRVVLAADRIRITGLAGEQTRPPRDEFRMAAASWGLVRVKQDADDAVRKHDPGTDLTPSIAWAAAELADPPVTGIPRPGRMKERWFRYYGPYGTLPTVPYCEVTNKPPGFFRDKVVFVGGKPRTRFLGEEIDEFRTPYTLKDNQYSSGVEIIATMFLNLWRGDWLNRLSPLEEFCLLLLAGLLFGYGLNLVRPLVGGPLAVLAFLGIGLFAVVLFWQQRIWFSWMIIAGAQVPCAFLWSVLAYTKRQDREKEAMKKELASTRITVPPSPPHPIIQPDAATPRSPSIPNYVLVRAVGEGAFGQVWLARNAIGMFHAVKIVSRQTFEDAGPYEREFKGIQKYMPISMNHPGLVSILHVGRNDEAGYFYSIMEAADDEVTGQKIDPDTYSPRTLSKDLQRRGRIPVEECLSLSLALTTGLDYLHWQQLIHRDIKPSNIIFVNGLPQLADIGLVTDIRRKDKDVSNLGTEGYMAPEGAGTPSADLYSLGKVIYVASMGKSVHDYPGLPTNLDETGQQVELLQLNQIILKACEEDAQKRYQSAEEMRVDLLRLQTRLGLRKS